MVGFYSLNTTARNEGHFVRTPRWRYIAFADGSEELYEIALDPFEESDVAGAHPEIVADLRERVAAWQSEVEREPAVSQVAGRLADEGGRGVAGAALRLQGRTGDGEPVSLQVLTGAGGRFEFDAVPRGQYSLRAPRGGALRLGRAEQRVPRLTLPQGTTGAWLPLLGGRGAPVVASKGSSLSGLVSTADGEPGGGAEVFVRGRSGRLPIRVDVRSDSVGRYRALHLPAGVYRVRAEVPPGYRRAEHRIELGPGEDRELDLVAVPR